MGRVKRSGLGGQERRENAVFVFPLPFPLPSFLLSPQHLPLGLLFLLSLIFPRHNKDGGYNSTNINQINKELSPKIRLHCRLQQTEFFLRSSSGPRPPYINYQTRSRSRKNEIQHSRDTTVSFNLKHENKREKLTESLHFTVEMTGSSKICQLDTSLL